MGNNNIYNYQTPKSGNEETGFFNIKGRINRKSFILRWLFSCGLFVIFTLGYYNGFFTEYESRSFIFFETIYFYILPLFISIFNLIQGAKRMHDVNKSGWYFFIPLYNIYLTFSPGTRGNNDYGIDPSPIKNIQYFDEIESNTQDLKEEVTNSVKKGGLDKWRDHLNQVRKQNPNKTYQEIREIARNTYKSNKPPNNKKTGTSKKKSKNYLVLLTIVVAAAIYYFNNNRHYFLNKAEYQDLEEPIAEEDESGEGAEYQDLEELLAEEDESGEGAEYQDPGERGLQGLQGAEEADEWEALIRTTDREKIKNIISKVQNINNNLEPDDGVYGIEDVFWVNILVNADKLPISTSDLFEFTKVKSIQGGPSGIFIYDYFSCRFNEKGSKIFFQKTSGSQRKSGYMYRKDEYSFVFLGGYSENDDPQTTYDSRAGEAGILYKISNNKIIMLFFGNGNYEIFEIIK